MRKSNLLLTFLVVILLGCNKHDIKHGSIELGCNGEGAIKIMEQNNYSQLLGLNH